jgi:large subunit ribosomal protein L18Ae
MYKEYRDTTLNGAVGQMYSEMASRHRVRYSSIQVIRTATVPAGACKRANTLQFHDSKIKFPLTRTVLRPSSKEFRTLYKAKRPSVAMF